MGRNTIAAKAVEAHPTWKHLALEVIEEASPQGEDADFHLQVIKRCAEELAKENMHLFLTLPSESEQYDALALALKPDCTTVHLGEETDGEYDYVIDPASRSVNDVTALLHVIMKES